MKPPNAERRRVWQHFAARHRDCMMAQENKEDE